MSDTSVGAWESSSLKAVIPTQVAARYLVPCAIAAVAVGLLAGVQPRLALLAVIGAAVAGLVLWNLPVGVCVFVFVAHMEALPRLGGAVSLAKVVGVLLVCSWILSAVIRPPLGAYLRRLRSSEAALLIGFLVWLTITLLWADDLAAGTRAIPRYALNLALFPIVAAAIRQRHNVLAFLMVMVAGAAMSAAYGILFRNETEGRLSGNGLNANSLGLLLIFGTVLAMTLACTRLLRPGTRILAALTALFCSYAMLVTVSRGALVGAAAALIAAVLFAGPGRRAKLAAFAIVAAGAAILYFVSFAPPEARQRVSDPGDGSGRVEIWSVGWRMVKANPVAGVGVGNFSTSAVKYLLEPGVIRRSEVIVDDQKVTHNVYLQILSESGAIGLVLYLGILGFSLGCALAAARRFERNAQLDLGLVSRGVLIALVGVLAASFFSSQVFLKPTWLMLALCPALLALSRSPARHTFLAGPR